MTGSPSAILTQGLGSWGSPGLIVTAGYGQGGGGTPSTGTPELTFTAPPRGRTFVARERGKVFSGRRD